MKRAAPGQVRFEFDKRSTRQLEAARAVLCEADAVLGSLTSMLRWLSLELLDQDDDGSDDVRRALLESHYLGRAVVRLGEALEDDNNNDGAT